MSVSPEVLTMKNRKYLSLLIMAAVVILELLPYGAVLNFANPEGEPFSETFSYFSLTPFGYANFGPFLTAVLSVVILIHILVSVIWKTSKLWKGIKVECAIASVLSIMPLMFGLDYYSEIGFVITILLVTLFFLSKQDKEEN